jgi:tRNA G46 methylase TrmB
MIRTPRSRQKHRSQFEAEFIRHQSWISRFTIDGESHGGDYEPSNDSRLSHFREKFPHAERILELGSLEGAHSILLASHPNVSEVIGVEGRKQNIDKTDLIGAKLDVKNVRFVEADLQVFDPLARGTFDTVFCVGLPYHLP